MTKEQYFNNRNGLMTTAKAHIAAGDIEAANKVMEEVKALDAKYEQEATARANMAALEGSPVVNYAMNFSDVTENTDCAEAVRWAASRGIAQGYSSGAFGVSDPVTREQFAALLYRCAQSKGQDFTGTWAFPLNYPDAQQVSGFAYEPLCWLTMNGVISGTNSGMLNPQGTATRAQAVVMLQRYLAL